MQQTTTVRAYRCVVLTRSAKSVLGLAASTCQARGGLRRTPKRPHQQSEIALVVDPEAGDIIDGLAVPIEDKPDRKSWKRLSRQNHPDVERVANEDHRRQRLVRNVSSLTIA